MLPAEVLHNLGRVSLCLAGSDAGLEPADDTEEIGRGSLRVECERRPEIDINPWILKLRRHHAHDLGRRVVQAERAADDVLIRAEASLPESVTKDADGILAGRVFAFLKRAAEDRINAEDFKKIRRHVGVRKAFRFAVAGEIRAAADDESERFEGAVLLAICAEVSLRNAPGRQAEFRTRLDRKST